MHYCIVLRQKFSEIKKTIDNNGINTQYLAKIDTNYNEKYYSNNWYIHHFRIISKFLYQDEQKLENEIGKKFDAQREDSINDLCNIQIFLNKPCIYWIQSN